MKVQGLFTMVEYTNLDAESAASIVDLFGTLFVKLAPGITNIQTHKDSSNVAIHDTPLLRLPLSLCNMQDTKFVALIVCM